MLTLMLTPRALSLKFLGFAPPYALSFHLHPPHSLQVTVYVYQLVDEEVRVEKIDYTKGAPV